jgi:hypothetical protein
MKLPIARLKAEIAQLRQLAVTQSRVDYSKYRLDPEAYSREVLKVKWWSKQIEIANALCKPPHKVLVKASHSIGKSHLGGGIINWWFDTRNPGVCLTTAPTFRQVKDVLWKEVRRQRYPRGGFPGSKIPRLESSPMHFASGQTATNATAFLGQHEEAVLLVYDEAVGVEPEFWEAGETMAQGKEFGWLCFYNPTDTTSRAYMEEQLGSWTVIDIAATDHPNIALELAGKPPEYPSAVRLQWLQDHLKKWAERIPEDDQQPGDLEFPPGSGEWHRPGPLAESRLLARWPTAGSGVWSDRAWGMAESAVLSPSLADVPEIGLDCARFGFDSTAFHCRCGPVSLYHEEHNGWGVDQIIGRLKQLCRDLADWQNERLPPHHAEILPQDIQVKLDDSGIGGAVIDMSQDWYNWHGVNAASSPLDPEDYPPSSR